MTKVAAIIIGRNEGERLLAGLASLEDGFETVIYVDSGSTDGSVRAASEAGAVVVTLESDVPFTAARARNAGIAQLALGILPDYVQFMDGDCALAAGWISRAKAFLDQHPDVAVVCGRRRERAPEASVYNRLCDAEWDTPIGETLACGGDALMRWDALDAVGGYNPDLIAGEEPEMCLRMRRLGWKIWRLDAEMTLHDAAMTRFGQFWARAKRTGYTYAEGAMMYRTDPERHGLAGLRRALIWGVTIPVFVLSATVVFGPAALLLLLVYPLQIARLALRDGGSLRSWEHAVFLTIGKFAEAAGVLSYHWRRIRGGRVALIEYK